jgi:hypothetical protein
MSERFTHSYHGFETQEAAEQWLSSREAWFEKNFAEGEFLIRSKIYVPKGYSTFSVEISAEGK